MPPKIYTVRNSFNSGEISELVSFRDDVAKYASACLTLENAVPLVEGGAKKMPGTYFGGNTYAGGAMFQASISGFDLLISENFNGIPQVGQSIIGEGVQEGTVIATASGPGGDFGPYTVNISQTVASTLMMTPSNGKSRLVPFQFSSEQGAFLEFSEGTIRVWEPSVVGEWALGLAQTPIPGTDYNPLTAYWSGPAPPQSFVLIGPYFAIAQFAKAGQFYVASPYGSSIPVNFNITVTTNSVDVLSVTATGASPSQGINIALANVTSSNNATTLIQAGIRALGALNSPANNYIDLSAWTVTPDANYLAAQWNVAPNPAIPYFWPYPGNLVAACTGSNQFDQFPRIVIPTRRALPGPPTHIIYDAIEDWNNPYWNHNTFPSFPIQVATPYLEADLFDLDCSTQSADVLWVFHHNYAPAVIERLSANLWQYSLALPGQQPGEAPYRGTTDVVKTGYSALGQSITDISQANPCVVKVAATGQPFASGSRIYMNDIAGMVELNQGEFLVGSVSYSGGTFSFSLIDPDTGGTVNSTGYLKYVSGGFAVQVVPLFAAPGDYPACGTLYQERLCVGGTDNNPVQMNGSVQGDYPGFICDPNAEDFAIQFTLVSNRLDQILNMIGTPNALVIGTSGGIWIMAGVNGGSLSQTSVTAAKQTSMGVSNLQPQLVGSSAIFISRSSRIVLFMVFNFASNQWDNYDLTRLNRVITLGPSEETSGIAQTSFQMEPYPIFWAVRNDGQLIGLVFNTQDQVYAWFRINLTPGKVESVAVISGKNQEDQIAVVVNRTINGVTQRSFEYFMPQEMFSQLSNAYFVNAGQQLKLDGPFDITNITNSNPTVVYAPGHSFTNGKEVQIQGVVAPALPPNHLNPFGRPSLADFINQDKTQFYTVQGVTPDTFQLQGMDTTGSSGYVSGGTVMEVTNEVTGMNYLIGQDVVAVGDGAIILEPTTVTSDTVTFDYYVNFVTIGLPYQLTVQPTNPTLSAQASTTRGMKQKLDRVTLSLYQSMGGKYGTDLDHMYDITYGDGTKAKTPQTTTALLTRDFDGDWNDEAKIYITQSDPLPFTLRGMVIRMSVNQD